MPANLRWKWFSILAVVVVCITGIIGLPKSTQQLAANWNRNIHLGLDLQGGSHIVLQIQVQDAFKAEADALIERLKDALTREAINYTAIDRNDPSSIETASTIEVLIKGVPDSKASEARRIATGIAGAQWNVATLGTTDYRLTIRPEAAAKLRQDTLTQSIATIDRKVSALGLAEASVQQRGGSSGESEILVQLPGVDDTSRVRSILQTSGLLELAEVKGGPFASSEEAITRSGGLLPLNTKLIRATYRAGQTGDAWWLLARSPVVTGRDLRDAQAQQSQAGRWETMFRLSPDAAQRFERYTEANIGKRLAIVLDGQVLSAPRIDSKISSEGSIMGAANHEEAADLALNLRAGSLPAGAKVMEERTVGPSLGADSIRQGVTAGLAGLALIVAAMLAYYRGAGFNAVLALLLNALITVAALCFAGATWTLPGIAGLVLSVGMAVDSNVLIFERIKEELRSGKLPASAIAAGFARAFATIIDTHVTTVVASALLFIFGTGPVRGFAVTLVIGLLANVFTAVFVSRAIFDVELWRRPRMQHLSIGLGSFEMFRASTFDFLSKRRIAIGLSLAVIAISLGSLILHGGPKYGLDFRGGTLMDVRFNPTPNIEDLRHTLAGSVKGELSLQELKSGGEFIINTELADGESLEHARQSMEETLRRHYPGHFEIRSVDSVGPRAGAEMRRQALLATVCALGGMLLYVAWRFRFVSGATAVIATVHDIVITLGLFSLTGREIDLTVIAALLTLIGYSMNDKIVVLDRIRENLHDARPGTSFFSLVNQSINQTLSRTILTGGLTLLACLSLYLFGGKVLNGIAFALCAGIVIGTYSSIFVSSALLVMWEQRRKNTRQRTLAELNRHAA